MSRTTLQSSPMLLGFDEVERLLDRASKSANGYPPYNIERLGADADQPARLRITLAVAGFGEDEIDIIVEENELIVHGRQADDAGRDYLHRGIAARQFQRTFVLAGGMEVSGAELSNGLLSIELVRVEPQRMVHRVKITSRD